MVTTFTMFRSQNDYKFCLRIIILHKNETVFFSKQSETQ